MLGVMIGLILPIALLIDTLQRRLARVLTNLALSKFGPRRWIALMMVTWGMLSTCRVPRSKSSAVCLFMINR